MFPEFLTMKVSPFERAILEVGDVCLVDVGVQQQASVKERRFDAYFIVLRGFVEEGAVNRPERRCRNGRVEAPDL